MKNKLKKGLAILLAGTILTSLVTPALAGEPEVTVDETAYITLDYYGSRSDPEHRKECAPQWQH